MLHLPRTFLLAWSLWLLASWSQAFFLYLWGPPSNEAYGLAVQYLLFSVGLGTSVLWPMFRLGLGAVDRPSRVAALDAVALIATLQVVVWPMHLLMPWTIEKILALDAFLCIWAGIVGATIAFWLHFDQPWTRSAGMLAALGLSVSAPVLFVLSDQGSLAAATELLHWSPVSGAWIMGRRSDATPPAAEWWRIGFLGAAMTLAWIGVALMHRTSDKGLPPVARRPRQRPTQPARPLPPLQS